MRLTAAVLLSLALNGPANAADSAWVWLESYKIVEPLCRDDIRTALKGLSTADLDDAIAISRERGIAVTSKVGTGGDLVAARAAMDEYRRNIVKQISEGVAATGCAGAVKRLGLILPKSLTKQQITELARSITIEATERTDEIPVADRIGTKAAYPLQKIVTATIVKDKRCDLSSLKVTLVSEAVSPVTNSPPFVGTPKSYEELWNLNCDGKLHSASVFFRQDARKWRSYKISVVAPKPAADGLAASPGLRRSIEN